MSFKPSDIFIGVIDFFSVILPGALITFFLAGHFEATIFGEGKLFPALTTVTQKWIAFLLASYIVGNLVFVVASWLDLLVYKRIRKLFFERNNDLSYKTATLIRREYILAAESIEIINTFKWSQYFLQLKHPDTIGEIKKLEADSKFFRSLAVAFFCMSIFLFATLQFIPGSFCFLLSLLSLYRYGDLRYKSTEKAYEMIITANSLDKPVPAQRGLEREEVLPKMAGMRIPAEHMELVDHLLPGAIDDAELITIAVNDKWSVAGTAFASTLYCIEGKSFLILQDETTTRIALAKGALVAIPKGMDYEISNKQEEPLLLVAFR
jgi:hypothetical protein